MATILTQVYDYNQEKTREWQVPAGTPQGAAIVSASNQPAVTLTPRGDSTATITLGSAYTLTYPNGAPGQRSDSATVATDGSWSGAVVDATSATLSGELVYLNTDGTLSLASTGAGAVKYGVTDNYPGKASATATTIKIGVFA